MPLVDGRVDSDSPEPVTPDGLSIWQYSSFTMKRQGLAMFLALFLLVRKAMP